MKGSSREEPFFVVDVAEDRIPDRQKAFAASTVDRGSDERKTAIKRGVFGL